MFALLLFINSADATALLARMENTYSNLPAVYLEAERKDDISSLRGVARNETRSAFAARADGRGRVEFGRAGVRYVEVSDGTRTYRAASDKKEWSVVDGAAVTADSNSRDLRGETRTILLTRYLAVAKFLEDAKLGKESDCRAGSFRGRCVELTGSTDGTRHEMLVDKEHGWVLSHVQEQERVDDGVKIKIRISIKLRELRTDPDDALFAFTPDGKWKQVDQILFPGEQRTTLPGDRAIDFTLASLEGDKVSLASLKGRVVVLSFWATWCPPCRAEMPMLNRLSRELGPDVRFVAIGNENPGVQKKFMKGNGFELQSLVDDKDEVHYRYGVRAIPTLYILDASGVIRTHFTGTRSERDIVQAIDAARK